MSTFHLRVLAADKAFFDGQCESLTLPVLDGQYGILPGHSNMIAAVVPGTLTFQPQGQPVRRAAISDGMVKVEDHDVLILADTIERPEEIDANRARRAAEAARNAMSQKLGWAEYRTARANLSREINRLRVKQEFGTGL